MASGKDPDIQAFYAYGGAWWRKPDRGSMVTAYVLGGGGPGGQGTSGSAGGGGGGGGLVIGKMPMTLFTTDEYWPLFVGDGGISGVRQGMASEFAGLWVEGGQPGAYGGLNGSSEGLGGVDWGFESGTPGEKAVVVPTAGQQGGDPYPDGRGGIGGTAPHPAPYADWFPATQGYGGYGGVLQQPNIRLLASGVAETANGLTVNFNLPTGIPDGSVLLLFMAGRQFRSPEPPAGLTSRSAIITTLSDVSGFWGFYTAVGPGNYGTYTMGWDETKTPGPITLLWQVFTGSISFRPWFNFAHGTLNIGIDNPVLAGDMNVSWAATESPNTTFTIPSGFTTINVSGGIGPKMVACMKPQLVTGPVGFEPPPSGGGPLNGGWVSYQYTGSVAPFDYGAFGCISALGPFYPGPHNGYTGAIIVVTADEGANYLRMTQRNDGLGVARSPRLAGAGSNGASSLQLGKPPRLGTSNTYL